MIGGGRSSSISSNRSSSDGGSGGLDHTVARTTSSAVVAGHAHQTPVGRRRRNTGDGGVHVTTHAVSDSGSNHGVCDER